MRIMGTVTTETLQLCAVVVQKNTIADGERVLLLPAGTIKGRDGRYWEMTEEDARALCDIAHSEGIDLVLDYDHQSAFGNGGPAAGWLTDLRVEPQGITAQLELCAAARQKVEAREYRYLSPAFTADGPRITYLLSVGLVNTPNIKELPALNRYVGGDMDEKQNGQEAASGNQDTQAATQTNAQGSGSANSAAQAEPNGLQQELTALKQNNENLLLQVNALQQQLHLMQQGQAQAELCSLVDTAITNGRLSPAQRESALALGQANRQALEQLIEHSAGFGQLTGQQAQQPPTRADLSAAELNAAKLMGADIDNLKKTKEAGHGGA